MKQHQYIVQWPYLVETLQQILYPALNLILGESGGRRVRADTHVAESGLHCDEPRGNVANNGGASDGGSPGGTEESGSEHGVLFCGGGVGLGGGGGLRGFRSAVGSVDSDAVSRWVHRREAESFERTSHHCHRFSGHQPLRAEATPKESSAGASSATPDR